MSHSNFTALTTTRLRLRRFQSSDLATLWAYRNDPEVARYQAWSIFSTEGLSAFIAEQSASLPFVPGNGFQFAAALRPDDQHIGDLFVRLLEYDQRQFEFGYSLARAYQGQGYASEAVRALLDEAFVVRGLQRAIALVDSANQASIRLLERVGMRREGHFLQSFENRNSWRDEYQYALLRQEWIEQRPG